MEKINFRKQKGVTLTDIATAVIIFTLFVGTVGNIYYSIAYNNEMIELNALATYYCVKIAEGVHLDEYSTIQDMTNQQLKQKYNEEDLPWPDDMNITLSVKNYNDDDATKEDIIKIVTIQAKYKTFDGKEETYEIVETKIRER